MIYQIGWDLSAVSLVTEKVDKKCVLAVSFIRQKLPKQEQNLRERIV